MQIVRGNRPGVPRQQIKRFKTGSQKNDPNMARHNLPALQFYGGDWRKDPGIQALNYFDRGVWFEMLLMMHESEDRGKLVLNGRATPN